MAALYAAKLFAKGLKLLHRAGSHNPGVLALKICPDFLARMDMPKTIIGITGTNGKTTVINMVDDILTDQGYQFVSNRAGSNILGGVITSLVTAINLKGETVRDLAVLELDERSSRLIYPYLKPNFLLVNNLFRDSFKRNSHSGFIFDILDGCIPAETKLILNGDDLISSRLASKNDRVYFRVLPQEGEVMDQPNIIQDLPYCPYCGAPMVYEFRRFHHIGQAHCSSCGFGSPEADYVFEGQADGYADIRLPLGTLHCKSVGSSISDDYNMAGIVALLSEFGLSPDQLRDSFEKLHIVKSRYHELDIAGKHVIKTVAKGQNPVACSRIFDMIRQHEGRKAVVLMIDDLGDANSTSENIAWLYDTDFEFLNDPSIVQVVAGGKRSADYRVRLLMAGLSPDKIDCAEREADAVYKLRMDECDTIFLLYDVYTVFNAVNAEAGLRKILGAEGGAEA